jgi:hypothetical protein
MIATGINMRCGSHRGVNFPAVVHAIADRASGPSVAASHRDQSWTEFTSGFE